MGARHLALAAVVLALTVAYGQTATAAPLGAAATPGPPLPLAVTPTVVRPGQQIHVSVSGLGGLPSAGKIGCLGVLGPGQNVALNRSPQFRPQIGTIAVGVNGSGQADATVPADLVPGSYQVVLGGCSPHGGLAPLATLAAATIQVIGPTATSPSPVRLPVTGGAPPIVAALLLALGLAAIFLGHGLRRAAEPRPG
jgi:hypothetical protein